MTQWYYCRDGQSVEGPVDLEELARLSAEGKFPANTSVAAAGEQEWRPLNSVVPTGPTAPPPLPGSKAESSSELVWLWNGFRTWFSRLGMRGKLTVVGCALLALMFLMRGSPDGRYQNSDGITDAEGEALVRNIEASVPNKQYPCPHCNGRGQVGNTNVRGLFNSSDDKKCETCNGNGTIRTASGYNATCPTCGGLGNQKTKDCYKCSGSGFVWGY